MKDKKYIKTIKQNNYNFLDASKMFLYSLVLPALFSLAFVIFLMMFSSILGISYSTLTDKTIMKYVLQAYVLVVYFLMVVFYSRKNNINFKTATAFSTKIDPVKTLVVILISVVAVFMFAPFINLLNHLFALIGYAPNSDLGIPLNTFSQLIGGVIVLAVLPAIAEEIVFRSVIFQGLQSKLSKWQAVIISAVMFMLLHGSLQQTVFQLILGIIFALVFYYTKNVLYTIILHFMNNFIVVMSAYGVKGEEQVAPIFATALDYILPVVLLVVGISLIALLIQYLKYGSFKQAFAGFTQTFSKNKSNKSINESIIIVKAIDDSNNENGSESSTSLVININNKNKFLKNFKSLTSVEKFWLLFGLLLGAVVWLSNTLSAF